MVRLARAASLVSLVWLGCSNSPSAEPPEGSGGMPGGSTGAASTSGAAGSAAPTGGGGGASGVAGSAGRAGSEASGGSASSGAGGSAAGATGAAGTSGVSGSAGSGTGGTNAAGDFCAMRAGLAFCEGFEEHSAGAAKAVGPWSPTMNGDGASIEIDTTVAHSGKSSLKVRAGGFNAFYSLDVAAAAKSVPGALYVRVYVRIDGAMASGHNAYVVADTVKAPGQGNAFKIGEMNAMLMYNVGGDAHAALSNNAYYNDQKVGAALSANEWGCLELMLNHEKPEIAVSLNGVDIPDMHHTDFPLDAYDAVRFGFEKYAGPMRDVWYDDVALGTAPLGCR